MDMDFEGFFKERIEVFLKNIFFKDQKTYQTYIFWDILHERTEEFLTNIFQGPTNRRNEEFLRIFLMDKQTNKR